MSYCITIDIDEHHYRVNTLTSTCYYYRNDPKRVQSNDLLHRLDGPAVIIQELSLPKHPIPAQQYWYYMGERMDCSSQQEFMKLLNLKVFW